MLQWISVLLVLQKKKMTYQFQSKYLKKRIVMMRTRLWKDNSKLSLYGTNTNKVKLGVCHMYSALLASEC